MILDDIIANKRLQLQQEKELKPLQALYGDIRNTPVRDFKGALNKKNISIIAEVKKASPSKGVIRGAFDPANIAQVYREAGMDAVSVLTERKFFQGQDEYIEEVKNVNTKPVLRKDFIIDEYQLYQSRAIGADAVLLIAAVLGGELKSYYEKAGELGLFCLVEVHTREELYIALDSGCDIIGINNRNLKTFNVDLRTTEELIRGIPGGITVVSESGIKSPQDVRYLRELGVNAVLIGETFMRKIDDVKTILDFAAEAKGAF
ncbi:MAG: indole-3-glycerol phosphate synthase [Clostridia bacterium BRH_c25]|nr:MAG: indole-3-glycerol phosphate synthase [Clostridia bacterium BRH_c25]